MPAEVMVIVIVAMALGLGLIGMIFDYLKHRNKVNNNAGSSMTTSELQSLLRDAVADATEPLAERIESIEQRLDRQERRLPPASSEIFDPYETEEPVRTGARVRG